MAELRDTGSGTRTTQPDRVLLAAVHRAADSGGWATADEIRREIDGMTGRGRWARCLWDHEQLGYLEQRYFRGTTRWALTHRAMEVLRDTR